METPREILIVDDDRQVRDVLHQIFLSAGYACHLAEDGPHGLDVFTAVRPALVVTDLKMPGMSGIELLQRIRHTDQDAAVIVLTGAADVKTAIESLKLGAHDFIMKPVNVEELLIAADRALERRELLVERRAYHELLEHRVEQATRELSAAYHELEDTYRSTLEALGSALDTRDIGTEAHSRRVHGYALATARAYGVAPGMLRDLAHGVLLHDIGKIGIPDAILLKPGPLTPEEWAIMRTHPEIGKRLIERIPFLSDIPLIGELFKSRSKTHAKTNLMVFIRPTIIHDAAEGDRMTAQRYGYMRRQQLLLNPDVEPSLDALVRDYMGAVPPIPPGTPITGTVIRPQQVTTVSGGAPAPPVVELIVNSEKSRAP